MNRIFFFQYASTEREREREGEGEGGGGGGGGEEEEEGEGEGGRGRGRGSGGGGGSKLRIYKKGNKTGAVTRKKEKVNVAAEIMIGTQSVLFYFLSRCGASAFIVREDMKKNNNRQ